MSQFVRRPRCELEHDHRHPLRQRIVRSSAATADSRRFYLALSLPGFRSITPSRNPAAHCRHRSSARWHRPRDWHHCRLPPHGKASNPHSRLASPHHAGACRGFLPRGLCNACPRSVVTFARVGASGQASHNPKQSRSLRPGVAIVASVLRHSSTFRGAACALPSHDACSGPLRRAFNRIRA